MCDFEPHSPPLMAPAPQKVRIKYTHVCKAHDKSLTTGILIICTRLILVKGHFCVCLLFASCLTESLTHRCQSLPPPLAPRQVGPSLCSLPVPLRTSSQDAAPQGDRAAAKATMTPRRSKPFPGKALASRTEKNVRAGQNRSFRSPPNDAEGLKDLVICLQSQNL